MTTVLIGADLCPIEGNLQYFASGDSHSLFHDLLEEFQKADLLIANLECPLITLSSPIKKSGPCFGVDNSCINGIASAGFDVLCLANNHILDHGRFGLESTLRACAGKGVETVGAGENLEAARKIHVRKIGHLRIGILAVAEHEFSIAGPDSPGANPLDLIDLVRNVRENRSSFDYLVVLFHGGDEFMVPSPRLKKTCRFMIEMGAKAVIVQHPHFVGGIEDYQSGHIVYGQGALVMDEAIYRDRRSFHEGILVKLSIADDASSTLEVVPFVQSSPVPGAKRMPAERRESFLKELSERSDLIQDDSKIEQQWIDFCDRNKHEYLSALLGHNWFLRRLYSLPLLDKLLYSAQTMRVVRNMVCCEAQREVIETILDQKN